jgi:hypothetical protein
MASTLILFSTPSSQPLLIHPMKVGTEGILKRDPLIKAALGSHKV